MRTLKLLFIILIALIVVSCTKKQAPSPISQYEENTPQEELNYSDIISVPYTEKGGNKYVSVKVNGIPFQMTFDSGASTVSISDNEVITLFKNGVLSENDFLGKTRMGIANGDIIEANVVNLREVVIGDMVFNNIKAVVVRNLWAPLLLGNNVLDNVASYTVDNKNKTINFELK